MKSTALKADREYWNIETLDIVKALQPSYMSLLPIYTITLFALFFCWKIKKCMLLFDQLWHIYRAPEEANRNIFEH